MSSRMLSQAETKMVEAYSWVDCDNCPHKSQCTKEDYSFGCDLVGNHEWEVVYNYQSDSKYGRMAINHKKKWKRGVTFDEFYGGSVVD